VGQRDEGATLVAKGKSRKVSTCRRQGCFAHIPVDDAQLRATVEEDTLACIGSLEDRCRTVGKVRFNDERIEVPGSVVRSESTLCDGLLQRSVNR